MELFSTPIDQRDGFGAQYQRIIANFIVINNSLNIINNYIYYEN
jgi:hypothetical protein